MSRSLTGWSHKEFQRWAHKYENRQNHHRFHAASKDVEKSASHLAADKKAHEAYRAHLHRYTAGKEFPQTAFAKGPDRALKQPLAEQPKNTPLFQNNGHVKPASTVLYDPLHAPILDDEITTLDGPVVLGGTRTHPARRRPPGEVLPEVQAVVLDLYDVLYSTPGRPAFLPEYVRAAMHGLGLFKEAYGDMRIVQASLQAQRALRMVYAGQYFQKGSQEPPTKVWIEHHKLVMQELGLDHPELAWAIEHAVVGRQVLNTLDAEAWEVLHTLKQRGYRLGLCVNTVRSHRARLERDGVLSLFHPQDIFFSYETGYWKPDEAAYRHVSHAMGVPLEQTAYVGARLEGDVGVAAKVGMFTVRVVHGRQPLRKAPGGVAVSHLQGMLNTLGPLAQAGVRDAQH
jgi:FMN phosphatase YigB (HAD superfamily)